jgi:hypothetical protein
MRAPIPAVAHTTRSLLAGCAGCPELEDLARRQSVSVDRDSHKYSALGATDHRLGLAAPRA